MAKGKKAKTVFVCQECGYESPKWLGQCICGAWNTFVEEKVPDFDIDVADPRRRTSGRKRASGSYGTPGNGGTNDLSGQGQATPLSKVGTGEFSRIDTGIGELNRVLGGGLVQGSLVLISGEPGIGKSTIIVQAAANIANRGSKVLYVTGEESEEQIKMRADRVCGQISDNLFILAETNMENIMEVTESLEPSFIIVDSIQTMYTAELDSVPGSVSQVRACGNLLMNIGKSRNVPIFIVAHVTKSGELAGPKIVEHLVDCVLSFSGERDHDLRILRAYKNRFGTTSEIGAFKMEEAGLVEIDDLSSTFLDSNGSKPEGSVVSAIYEGSRPVLLEIQALTAPANVGFARRTSVGIDNQRLSMILAVLEKKCGLTLINQDVYVNVVGGIRPDSTSVDLAVALTVYSSIRGVTCPKRLLAVGEIGLTGEIRSIRNVDKIVSEAIRMGYEEILVPAKNVDAIKRGLDAAGSSGSAIIGIADIHQAIKAFKG